MDPLDRLQGIVELFHDAYTFRVVREMWSLLLTIAPGLLIGLALSALLVAWWPIERLQRIPQTHRYATIALMASLGVVSPFCSYLAIPIAAALIASGLPAPPVMAFLCATPLMNPTLFFMTWSTVGLPMALARALAALGLGIVGGLVAGKFAAHLTANVTRKTTRALSSQHSPDPATPYGRRWWDAFRHLGWFASKYVLLGVCLAAIVKEVVPMEWVETLAGQRGGYGVATGVMLGIPLYACGGGTIPLIQVLLEMGMSPGAALGFFVAGPATKLPFLAAMQMTMGSSVTAAYVALSLAWAFFAGLLFLLFC